MTEPDYLLFIVSNLLTLPDQQFNAGYPLLEHFLNALHRIASFARKIDSPFSSAFDLAALFLNNQIPNRNFDNAHWGIVNGWLKQQGFDERSIANTERSFSNSSADLIVMRRPDKINALIALDLADVFGGMGSWNDQVMETEEMNSEHLELTASTFSAWRLYFTEMISSERSDRV